MSSEGLYKLNEIALINPKRKVLKGNEVPFIEMAALPLSSRDIQKKDVEIRVAKNSGSHFKNGDTLLARITPCLENGKGAQVNCFSDGEIGEGSTEFIVLCGISSEDNDFVYYLTRTDEFRAYAISRMEGTSGRQRVSWQSIAAYEFYLPDLHFRRSAAALLTKIDDRITLLRETNATLEAIAQALFKSWFVDFDPVHANAHARAQHQNSNPQAVQQNPAPHAAETMTQNPGLDAATAALFPDHFQDSDLGPIPAGWRVESLDSIADFLNGLALQKFPPREDSWLPVIKIAQLKKGDTVGADRASRDLKPEYVIKNGDVLFSWSGSLEIAIWCGGEGALNQHLFKVTSESYPKWFYYLWTKHHLPDFQQIAASKATTMGHIQRKHLSEAKVVVPPIEIIDFVGKTISPLLDAWLNNAEQAQTLTQLRDTLLPRLISGQLRLPDAEAQIEAVVGGA